MRWRIVGLQPTGRPSSSPPAVPADDTIQVNDTATEEDGGKPTDGAGKRRTPQRDLLIACCEIVELWHDLSGVAHATFPVADHFEHWPIMSENFKGRFVGYDARGSQSDDRPSTALEDGLHNLSPRPRTVRARWEAFLRDGRISARRSSAHLDADRDDRWRTGRGGHAPPACRVVEKYGKIKAPKRSGPRGPLPGQEARLSCTIGDEACAASRWALTTASSSARGRFPGRHAAGGCKGPFPVLAVTGEQGAGKSVVCRMMRALIDPSAAPIRAVPKELIRDLLCRPPTPGCCPTTTCLRSRRGYRMGSAACRPAAVSWRPRTARRSRRGYLRGAASDGLERHRVSGRSRATLCARRYDPVCSRCPRTGASPRMSCGRPSRRCGRESSARCLTRYRWRSATSPACGSIGRRDCTTSRNGWSRRSPPCGSPAGSWPRTRSTGLTWRRRPSTPT